MEGKLDGTRLERPPMIRRQLETHDTRPKARPLLVAAATVPGPVEPQQNEAESWDTLGNGSSEPVKCLAPC
jgi:hypothetical protein